MRLRERAQFSQHQGVADAEGFALFGYGDASVGSEAVEVVEASGGRCRRQGITAHFAELLLEADEIFASVRIARRYRASRARIAALECDVTYFEAYRIIFLFAEKLVFPERGHAVDFESSAKAFARVVQFESWEKIADRLQRCGRDNGRSRSEPVIGHALWHVAHDDSLLKIF